MICCGPGSDLGWEWGLTPRVPILAQNIELAESPARHGLNLQETACVVFEVACELF